MNNRGATFQEISDRKKFRENETVSLDKKIIDQKGGKGLGKKENV